MASNLAIAVLVFVFCISVDASRTKLYAVRRGNEMLTAPSPSSSGGICKLMVEPQGYVCQEHKVTTKDGYILSMQRMPTSRSGVSANKPPVLMQHGLMMDGITWMMNPPAESPAFIFADNGYDVWIANGRGTKYSRRHTTLTPSDSAYWDWSWDQLVAYDLPAVIQYVYHQTGQKMHYVGHSLGTLIALAAISQDSLVSMLRTAALLCPIAHLNHISSPITKSAADFFLAEDLYWLGLSEFDPNAQAVLGLLEALCKEPGVNCNDLMSAITGENCCLSPSSAEVYVANEPQPTATKNLIHLSQMIRQGTIAMYDYGNQDQNMNHYGQPTPPIYNMTSIPNDFPLFIGYGGQDKLADVNDVHILLKSVKDHESDKLAVIYRPDYAHADFVMGVNCKQVVFNPMMAFFKLN